MLERRRHSRVRDFAVGTVAHGAADRGCAMADRVVADCVVRNASEAGAMLLLDEPRRLPAALELATRDGVRPAHVVWRGETGVGVAFLHVPVPAPAAPLAPAAVVVDLDAARRRRAPGSDEARLAERVARYVRPSRRPDGA